MAHDDAGNTIRLDQFLKLQGVVSTGGQAKLFIQNGDVLVNDQVETRRHRTLQLGDIVRLGEFEWEVASDEEDEDEDE